MTTLEKSTSNCNKSNEKTEQEEWYLSNNIFLVLLKFI